MFSVSNKIVKSVPDKCERLFGTNCRVAISMAYGWNICVGSSGTAKRIISPRAGIDPVTEEVTISRIAISIRMRSNVFFPQNLQRHVLAFQLARNKGPIRLAFLSTRRFGARHMKLLFQVAVADRIRQWPDQPNMAKSLQRIAHRSGSDAQLNANRPRRQPSVKM